MEELIKSAARQQMAEHGTAGLSLRGIARELGITAPAIYNYFPQLENLIPAYQYELEAFAHLLQLGGRPDRASGESNHNVA